MDCENVRDTQILHIRVTALGNRAPTPLHSKQHTLSCISFSAVTLKRRASFQTGLLPPAAQHKTPSELGRFTAVTYSVSTKMCDMRAQILHCQRSGMLLSLVTFVHLCLLNLVSTGDHDVAVEGMESEVECGATS